MKIINEELPLGAEVQGLDLRHPLSGEAINELRRVIHERGVVVIRGQKLTPMEQIAFGKYFGEPEEHVMTEFALPGFPEIWVVSNVVENGKKIGVDAGKEWHTDLSYMARPTYLSMLYAIEVPHKDGTPLGSTHFASTAFAYDTLSDDMKSALGGKKARHSFAARAKRHQEAGNKRNITQEQLAKTPDIEHPVFRRHPYCEKTCVFVSKSHTTEIVGLGKDKSAAYLNELWSHCARPDFIYQHEWRVGDLLIWDNTQTQHLATFDYTLDQPRRMHRVSIKGTPTF